MWCKSCNRETDNKICEVCGEITVEDIPVEIYWCSHCNVPIIRPCNSNIDNCPECGKKIKYFAADLRPVFPQERLLMEIVKKTPLKYINSSVWCANNRYYIDGESIPVSFSKCLQIDTNSIIKELEKYSVDNEKINFRSTYKNLLE